VQCTIAAVAWPQIKRAREPSGQPPGNARGHDAG
jgi:hypothetical protein